MFYPPRKLPISNPNPQEFLMSSKGSSTRSSSQRPAIFQSETKIDIKQGRKMYFLWKGLQLIKPFQNPMCVEKTKIILVNKNTYSKTLGIRISIFCANRPIESLFFFTLLQIYERCALLDIYLNCKQHKVYISAFLIFDSLVVFFCDHL